MRSSLQSILLFVLIAPDLAAQVCDVSDPLGLQWSYLTDVSDDGQIHSGSLNGDAVVWSEAGGVVPLGTFGGSFAIANALSADGRVAVGAAVDSQSMERAFRWDATTGMQDLGELPGGGDVAAYDVSADGTVIVGESGGRAFRWTLAGGMQSLGDGRAEGVSADGQVIVGMLFTPAGNEAFRWTSAGGMQVLGPGTANATSADGSVVVGDTTGAGGGAFRWDAVNGVQQIPLALNAIDVSADGRVVLVDGARWTASEGRRSTLMIALGLSADGTIIVGMRLFPSFPFLFFLGTREQSSVLGQVYCRPSVPNRTGCGGIILATGDTRLATGTLDLSAAQLPPHEFGIFLASRTQDMITGVGGSEGILCLGGTVERFVGPGQVLSSGPAGQFTLSVDLNGIPNGSNVAAVQAGETWNFQAWHRDTNPMPTSNFTDAVGVTFQ